MKKFKFKYENILKLRLDYENDIKNKLKKQNKQMVELEDYLKETRMAYDAYKYQISVEFEQGVKGFELKEINQFQLFFRKRIESILLDIEYLENEIERTKEELMEAIKERKIMEKIKEKDFKAYLDAINVMEGKATDEVVNFQNSRRSGV